jgi:hypothetical protein
VRGGRCLQDVLAQVQVGHEHALLFSRHYLEPPPQYSREVVELVCSTVTPQVCAVYAGAVLVDVGDVVFGGDQGPFSPR